MISALHTSIKNHQLDGKRFLLALSGGVDSMVLAHLFLQSDNYFEVAHCNFQLRDDASKDAALVERWCAQHAITLYTTQFDTEAYMKEHGLGVQEAARNLRYTYFNGLLEENSLNYIVTAHHADDNIETVLFNICRGTSIKGVCGMSVLQSTVFRPMLSKSKADIILFAKENNIEWREDLSNCKNNYTRNFLRNEIIPRLESQFPNVKNKLLGTINRLAEAEEIYTTEIKKRIKKLLFQTGSSSYKVPIRKLQQQQPLHTVIYELFSPFQLKEKQIPELLKLLTAKPGSRLETKTHIFILHRNHIVIEEINALQKQHYLIEGNKGSVQLPNGILSWEINEKVPSQFNKDKDVVCLDARSLQFPLLLRRPRIADYFYPLGMNKKKKLSRFFIDNKLSLLDKERQWVLENEKKITWVIGLRIDERFKITKSTKKVLHLKWRYD
jgi:tRNA(Ile)-lysidine synthase